MTERAVQGERGGLRKGRGEGKKYFARSIRKDVLPLFQKERTLTDYEERKKGSRGVVPNLQKEPFALPALDGKGERKRSASPGGGGGGRRRK